MSTTAAFMASLVDVRNVAAHKSVRLEIHVPAEQAGAVLAAFGWPTMADPVPVAIARLGTETATASEPPKAADEPKPRRPFSSLSLAQQAGMRCQEQAFKRFLEGRGNGAPRQIEDVDDYVRLYCGVKSRSELALDTPAGAKWFKLNREFEGWLVEAAYR